MVVIGATYRRPDQAPFSAWKPRSPEMPGSVFIAERPTLRQEVATAAACNIAVLQWASLSARLSGILPPIRNFAFITTTIYTREPTSIPTCCLPMSPPTAPRTAAVQSKCIAASCQSGEASFIAPYRNHRGHAFALRSSRSLYVAAALPIRS